MDQELDKKLVSDFPLLFRDRYADCRRTCMCWGFPGNGWEPLIRELAGKLEKLIKEHLDKNMYKLPCTCGHSFYEEHWGRGKVTGVCNYMVRRPIWEVPYARGCHVPENKIKKFFVLTFWHTKWRIQNYVSRFFWFLAKHTPIHIKDFCDCVEYTPDHPSASQVKEKFGTLRFYMTSGTEEMYNLIHEAEEKSGTICEDCGKPGKIRHGGWIRTLCDECCTKDGRDAKEEEWLDDDEDEEAPGAVILDIRPQVEIPASGDQKNL